MSEMRRYTNGRKTVEAVQLTRDNMYFVDSVIKGRTDKTVVFVFRDPNGVVSLSDRPPRELAHMLYPMRDRFYEVPVGHYVYFEKDGTLHFSDDDAFRTHYYPVEENGGKPSEEILEVPFDQLRVGDIVLAGTRGWNLYGKPMVDSEVIGVGTEVCRLRVVEDVWTFLKQNLPMDRVPIRRKCG